MQRSPSRRYLSAGALLVLALGVGGFSSAMADEAPTPVPTGTATANAAPATSPAEQPAPSPSPSSPTAEATSTPVTPTGQSATSGPPPEGTPSSGASDTSAGEGSGGQPATTPSGTATATKTAPRAEPTTTTPADPAPQTPTPAATGDPTATGARQDAAAAGPQAAISAFDCTALTASVTLDNSGGTQAQQFTVEVSRWVTDRFEQLSYRQLHVEAGQVDVTTAELADNAYNRVTVWGPSGSTLASREGSCGQDAIDPRATIDSVDCQSLQAAVTLDNSRSTEPITFRVYASSWSPTGSSPAYDQRVEVPAGEAKAVSVPVVDDAKNAVYVYAGPSDALLASREGVICGEYFQAAIGQFDCGTLTAPVTLDNSLSTKTTRFEVGSSGYGRPTVTESLDVAPGTITATSARLFTNAINQVQVSGGPLNRQLASAEGTCGRYVHDPRAAFGELDCRNLTVPVRLDNTRSVDGTGFAIEADFGNVLRVDLAAGEARTVQYHFPAGADVFAVFSDSGPQGHTYLAYERKRCENISPEPVVTPAARPTPSTRTAPAAGSASAPQAAPAAVPVLAFTGAEISRPILIGLAFVLVGAALVLTSRRRRS